VSCPGRKKTHEHEITSAKNRGARKKARKIEECGSANAKAQNLRPKKERESASAKSFPQEREALKKARAQLCLKVHMHEIL
jgi:hypothetical protein